MWLKPGHEAIYQEKHDHIWPEMLTLMKERGIRNWQGRLPRSVRSKALYFPNGTGVTVRPPVDWLLTGRWITTAY